MPPNGSFDYTRASGCGALFLIQIVLRYEGADGGGDGARGPQADHVLLLPGGHHAPEAPQLLEAALLQLGHNIARQSIKHL